MKPLIVYTAFFLLVCGGSVAAQTGTPQAYSMMVVPFTSDDQKISEVLKDDTWRNLIRELQGILNENGYTMTDFLAIHKKYLQHTVMGDAAPSDLKSDFLRFADPDIYIEVDMKIMPGGSPGTHRAVLTLNAYLTATGLTLSTMVCNGNYFQSNDALALARSAMRMCFDQFNGTFHQKLSEMDSQGIPLEVQIQISDAVAYDFDSLVKMNTAEEALADACETWIRSCTLVKSYQARRGNTVRNKIFNEVRLPLINPETGRFSSPGEVAASFKKFCRQLTLEEFPGKKITVQGSSITGTLYITLN
ncbi:MAG TPA: DUF6175 family protein [Saprospiraceae bacterium]|nr:DUF6175 family protein [Saprospiraceae bacterium]HPI05152.1 DUF6175 family protein [Saprospiraceae bacterium]